MEQENTTTAADQAGADPAGVYEIPSALTEARHGFIRPRDLPLLFLHFGLELIEGLAFPWAHKWAPTEGRALEQYRRRQTERRILRIEPAALQPGREDDGPLHPWQLSEEKL